MHAISGLTGSGIIGTMDVLAAVRAPGFLPGFLFENQWWIWIAMAGLAGALGWMRLGKWAGGVVAVLAVWVGLAAVFVTPGERLEAAHRGIVNAAQTRNCDALCGYLASDFSFGVMGKTEMRIGLKAVLEWARFESNRVRFYEGKVEGDLASSQVNVLTLMDAKSGQGGPYVSKWWLEWRDEPGADWKLVRVRKWVLNEQEMPADLGLHGQ